MSNTGSQVTLQLSLVIAPVRGALTAAVLATLFSAAAHAAAEEADPAQIAIGERLFLETRFAQSYAANPDRADPVTDSNRTTGGALPGPLAGGAMNCRSCHMVDEQLHTPGGVMRAYADFARRSPITARPDGETTAGRNAQTLVGASLPRPNGLLLHHDGEFASFEDLVLGTLTGRNRA